MPTATYTAAATAHSRRVQWLVEIDLDRCSLDYTTAPCTATDLGNGSRCWYTFQTCQDPTNFTRTTRTLRFCLNEIPWEGGEAVYPLLKSIVPVPQSVDAARLETLPETITMDFAFDHLPPAPDTDKTLSNTTPVGEFWRNLVARNRNYVNRPVRVYRGFAGEGLALADFEQVGPAYKIKKIELRRDGVHISAESPLADLKNRKVPWTISDDNTLQADISNADTSIDVRDDGEYPAPGDYSFSIYLQIEDEIARVTSYSLGTNTMGIARGQLGTTAVSHTAGKKVSHVAFFGTDNGASPPTARNVVDVMLDLLEWCRVAPGDIDTASFDKVKTNYWPNDDTLRILTRPIAIAKNMQNLRGLRGCILYINGDGQWALTAMVPDVNLAELTDESFLYGTTEVFDDEEERLTRVGIWYDPQKPSSTSLDDMTKGVVVVDTDLENANNYGDVKDDTEVDTWVDPAYPVSKVRNLARRKLARQSGGVRTIAFGLDVKDASLQVGDQRLISTRQLTDAGGTISPRPCLVTSRKESAPAQVAYEAVDLAYNGRFLRIGPDTQTDSFDSATASEKGQYSWWGDDDNRVGALLEPGWIFW